MLPYKSSGCSQSGQRRTFGVGKLRLSRPEQRIVPVERPSARAEAVQTFHLPGKSAARTPLALAVLVGTAVALADAIGPQPEVEAVDAALGMASHSGTMFSKAKRVLPDWRV